MPLHRCVGERESRPPNDTKGTRHDYDDDSLKAAFSCTRPLNEPRRVEQLPVSLSLSLALLLAVGFCLMKPVIIALHCDYVLVRLPIAGA